MLGDHNPERSVDQVNLVYFPWIVVVVRLIMPEGYDWNHAWTQFWDLPEGHLLNLAPMQNYSFDTNSTDNYLICGGFY